MIGNQTFPKFIINYFSIHQPLLNVISAIKGNVLPELKA